MTFKTLLPPNATQTEKRLEQALSYDLPLWSLTTKLKQLRTSRPAPFNQWLAGEWGISEFRPFFNNDTDFFNAVVPWLQCRGTATATIDALSFIGVDNATLDVEHFRLHVHLDKPWQGDLSELKRMTDVSIPLHLQFYRVTSGCDVRHGRYDETRYDDCLYDDDSGVWESGLKVNFCTKNSYRLSGFRLRAKLSISAWHSYFLGRTWESVQRWRDEPWTTCLQPTQIQTRVETASLTMNVVDSLTADASMTARLDLLSGELAMTRENKTAMRASLPFNALSGQITSSGPDARTWESVSVWDNEVWALQLNGLGTVTL